MNAWELLEAITWAGDATKTTGALAAKKQYLIVLKDFVVVGGTISVYMQCNGDTGNNYERHFLSQTTLTYGAAQPRMNLGAIPVTHKVSGFVIMAGKSPAVASGVCQANILFGTSVSSNGISGSWIAGNAVQITDFTVLLSSGTASGSMKVYGRD